MSAPLNSLDVARHQIGRGMSEEAVRRMLGLRPRDWLEMRERILAPAPLEPPARPAAAPARQAPPAAADEETWSPPPSPQQMAAELRIPLELPRVPGRRCRLDGAGMVAARALVRGIREETGSNLDIDGRISQPREAWARHFACWALRVYAPRISNPQITQLIRINTGTINYAILQCHRRLLGGGDGAAETRAWLAGLRQRLAIRDEAAS